MLIGGLNVTQKEVEVMLVLFRFVGRAGTKKKEFHKYLYLQSINTDNILSAINNYYSVVRPYENTVGSVN